jgi:predicted trehalose synthase
MPTMQRELESARLTVVPWDTPFEILKGTYTRHRFAPHLHDTFALGAIEAGASKIRYRDRTVSQRAGDVVLIPRGEVHTGESDGPQGWSYRMLYLPETLLAAFTTSDDLRFDGPSIADPELARRMVELMRDGADIETGEATIVFRATGELPSEIASARPMGAEQSNSSLVLDERYALKLYRRIEPGMNPELEVLRFLTAREFEHTAALEGYIAYEGRPLEATLAVLQEFVPARGDGWELALDSLAGGDPEWLPRTVGRLGEVTAFLHNALASDPTDPQFAPDEPSSEALALLSASVDEEIEQVFSQLPGTDAIAPVAGRGEEVRDCLRTLTHIGQVGKAIRTHGDYHLGQALWTNADDWLILDFEGEPARSVPERRRKVSPLRDVAGMLRSFAYAASAASIQRGVEPPPGWEQRCREGFLAGYLEAVEPSLLPGGSEAVHRLLTIFELEKAVYELRYELHNRPEWVSIPVAGVLRLLEPDE